MLREVVDGFESFMNGKLHHEMLFYCRWRDVWYV
jgi:hypothetical protein